MTSGKVLYSSACDCQSWSRNKGLNESACLLPSSSGHLLTFDVGLVRLVCVCVCVCVGGNEFVFESW